MILRSKVESIINATSDRDVFILGPLGVIHKMAYPIKVKDESFGPNSWVPYTDEEEEDMLHSCYGEMCSIVRRAVVTPRIKKIQDFLPIRYARTEEEYKAHYKDLVKFCFQSEAVAYAMKLEKKYPNIAKVKRNEDKA